MLYYRNATGPRREFWRRSTAAIAGREQRGAGCRSSPAGKKKSEAEQLSWQFWALSRRVYRLAPEGRAPDAKPRARCSRPRNGRKARRQPLRWRKWRRAARAAIRACGAGARAPGPLAEWQKRDALRNAALGQAGRPSATPQAEAENNARLAAIDARIQEIDKELAAKFPDYAALASPAPLAVEEVQAQLGANEALVLFLDTPEWKPTPEETFIWVVTKTDMRWVRSDLGTAALAREVQALRCGLDAEAWDGPRCAELTGQTIHRRGPACRQAAAVRSCPRLQALPGAVRPGRRTSSRASSF